MKPSKNWRSLGAAFVAIALLFGACDGAGKKDAVSQTSDSSEQNVAPELLLERIERTLESNRNRRILAADRNAAWQVLHGGVAYGDQLQLDVEGKRVRALPYLFQGGALRGWEPRIAKVHPVESKIGLQFPVEEGTYVGQGHVDQWLGYLSQIPIGLETELQVDGQRVSVRDWALQSRWEVSDNPYREYSWTLIGLTNYFPDGEPWQAKDGKEWTLEPLVRFEAQQDLNASACGGMHRLMGLAHAVRYRERLKGRFDGGWLLAKQVVERSIDSIKRFQNSDGSFSTNYTERPGISADLSTCISATGHTLEFVVYMVDDQVLRESWVARAVKRMCDILEAGEAYDLECGGIYHALSALRIYRDRMKQK